MRAQEFITEGAGQKPIIIYTNNRGATIDDDIKKSLPVTQISFDQLRQWESHKSMKDPKVADWVNNKLLPELKQNGILKPLLLWNNNGEFFVIDGNHRFIAYQEAGYRGRVPVQIVPDSMITVSDTVPGQQDVAEGKQPGQPVVDAILKVMPIAQEIWFHGSRATGKHRKNSDTDILVVVPDDLVGDQYLGVVRILQKLSSHFDNYDIQPTHPGYNIHLIAQEEGRLLWSNKQGMAEDQVHEADASTVQFQTASTDNYQSSFTVTAIADGKNVGHFSFFRDPETDDVHNQAEVTDDVRGKGYGKALLLKAIEVANDHGLGFQEDSQSLSRAQSRVYDSLYDAGWIVDADGYWFLTPEGEQELARLSTIQQGVAENFHDGRNPGRKGLAKRSGVNTKASVSSLRKTAKNSSGEKQRMAHWLANMKAGRAKAKRK